MDFTQLTALIAGGAWGSGINVYLTMAALGIAHRLEWVTLPGDLSAIAHPLIILLLVALYVVEFFADKVPYVDSAWDTVHTFIRPAGGLALGYMAMAGMGPVAQTAVGVLAGSIAMDSHLTKATSRAAINTSPEPVTNIAASVTEDVCVCGAIWLIIKHPIVMTLLVIAFIVASFFFLKMMFHLVKKIFKREPIKPVAQSVDVPSPDQKERK